MAESVVSLTYGAALFEAAKELDKEDVILGELESLEEILDCTRDFAEFLNSPAIEASAKKQVIKETLEGKFSKEMVNFLYVLVDKQRTAEIRKVRSRYIELYDQERGVAEGEIISVIPLTEQQLARFEKEMSKLLRKNIKLANTVDKTLIGGVKIKVDGKMIDKSLKGDLDMLLGELKKY